MNLASRISITKDNNGPISVSSGKQGRILVSFIWIWMRILPLTSYVPWGNVLNFLVTQFPRL